MADLTGKVFGRLTVLYRTDDRVGKSGYHEAMWACSCECGNTVTVRAKCLSGGVTKSCGCYAREVASESSKKHGGFGTRLYAIWNSMRQRCNNPRNRAYANYGGRGIQICSEWDDYAVFRRWAEESGYDENAPRGSLTLDRINVDGGYSPDNCRWADMAQQSSNKRNTPRITYNGETHTLKEWAKITGLKYETIWKRYSLGRAPEVVLAK